MSKTGYALLVKFIMTFIFAAFTFALIDRNAWGWVLLVALAVTALNYLIGDLRLLPSYGNIVASVGEGIIGGLTAWVLALLVPAFDTSFAALFVFAVLTAIGGYFFHQYLLRTEKAAP
ncbi:MAG TPA: DUF2512 family protein [Desulfotomaculum sp.]|nr:DUF2512 family protein [Desulfotomaculum sp.]